MKHDLYLRWISANATGEMIGLGLTFAAGIGLFLGMEPQTVLQVLLFILLMTATGIIEGSVVGLAQWSVLRRALPEIARGAWVGATTAGALLAWFLGSLPSSLLSLQAETVPSNAGGFTEPSTGIMLVMAAGMGMFLGFVLAFPQWLVLRKHLPRAAWWFPANGAAWMVGMPVVFAAVGWAYDSGSIWQAVLLMALSLWITGAVVGAVHGIALVNLVRIKNQHAALPVPERRPTIQDVSKNEVSE